MKVRIEKELCDPVNGEIVGPKYHIFKVDEETREKELVGLFMTTSRQRRGLSRESWTLMCLKSPTKKTRTLLIPEYAE